ncbi:MAG: CHC2 zinc finger domain-containing protein, partial [Bacteroidota bacterium]
MGMRQFNVEMANEIDLVDYLEQAGHSPKKIRNKDYWYLSPLRAEKTPSFKINRAKNVWYDHGIGQGGRFVDFGIQFYNCTITELLARLRNERELNPSFHPHQNLTAGEKKNTEEAQGKIIIDDDREIKDKTLLQYLQDRLIPSSIARIYCREIEFTLYDKKYLAIGFKNDSGGYELRNAFYKGSNAPKSTTLISQNEGKALAVFEGFFSFLSYQAIQKKSGEENICLPDYQGDYLILNSLSFFEKSRQLMEQYTKINLFLDRDSIGIQ